METELQKLLNKVKAGKRLTDAEIEKLPDGKLKDRVKKRQAINKLIEKDVTRENKRSRTVDTRRKVLWGAWLEEEMKQDARLREYAYLKLDSFLSRPGDRALFGLPPRSAAPVEGNKQSAAQEETV